MRVPPAALSYSVTPVASSAAASATMDNHQVGDMLPVFTPLRPPTIEPRVTRVSPPTEPAADEAQQGDAPLLFASLQAQSNYWREIPEPQQPIKTQSANHEPPSSSLAADNGLSTSGEHQPPAILLQSGATGQYGHQVSLPAPITEVVASPGSFAVTEGLSDRGQQSEMGLLGRRLLGSPTITGSDASPERESTRPSGLTSRENLSADAEFIPWFTTAPRDPSASIAWTTGLDKAQPSLDPVAVTPALDPGELMLATPQAETPLPIAPAIASAPLVNHSEITALAQWFTLGLGHEGQQQQQQLTTALGEHLKWQVNQQIHTAQIQLHPAELGSIAVSVHLEAGKTWIHLSADTPQTLLLLQQTTNDLKDKLTVSPGDQVQVDVSSQGDPSRQQAHREQQDKRGSSAAKKFPLATAATSAADHSILITL